VPAIHIFDPEKKEDVDAWDKPAHDDIELTDRPFPWPWRVSLI